MVPAVHGGPPQHAALRRGLRQKAKAELKHPAGAEGAMGEVAMIPRPDREDPQQIQPHAERHGGQRHPAPEHAEARQMHQEKRGAGGIGDILCLVAPAHARGPALAHGIMLIGGGVLMGSVPW